MLKLRNCIIALGALCYLASVALAVMALRLPKTVHMPVQSEVVPPAATLERPPAAVSQPSAQVQQTLARLAEEQAQSKAVVKELQSTINNLKQELARNKEKVASQNATSSEAEGRVIAVLGGNLFASGQAEITPKLRSVVANLVGQIHAAPAARVSVEGHTDNVPIGPRLGRDFTDNLTLSFLRARAVADLLIEFGVPRDRIGVTGYGDTRPVAPNDTRQGRAGNRRVDIRLIPAG